MSRPKLMWLLVCVTLVFSLVACSGEIKIVGKRLFGKSNIDLGKPVSLSNMLMSDCLEPIMSQRGDEIFFSMPVTKEGGGISTSQSYKIKGDIYKLFNIDIGNKELIWMTTKAGKSYFLYCFQLTYNIHQHNCQLEKIFEVETETPKIVTTFGSFDIEQLDMSSNENFIICQSTNFDKITYYDLKGRILNEYSIGKIALSSTTSEYDKLYGFDGKNIYSMSPIMTSKTRIFTTNRYQTWLNLNLESTEFLLDEDLFFYNKSNLHIVKTNSIEANKTLFYKTFSDIQKFDVHHHYVAKSDGIYALAYDNSKLVYALDQVYKNIGRCHFIVLENGVLFGRYLKIVEEVDNKYRICVVMLGNGLESKSKNYSEKKIFYSDFLETKIMPFWYDTAYYNADGVWLTNIFAIFHKQALDY